MSLTVGEDGAKPEFQRDVWAHHWQHFDDNHTEWVIHARVYAKREGLTWRLGEKTRTETDLALWVGQRAQAGRLPPNGFPKNNKFG